MRAGRLYHDEKFTPIDSKGRPIEYLGLYLICDGGYHKWRMMQCPNKNASAEGAKRFSQRLESVRKDAECTFGILKKRWRILKNHMLIHNEARIDNMVFTCAVLHNMLIAHDATDEWKDEDDNYDIAADIPEHEMDPRIIHLRDGPVDRSHVGGGNIADHDIEVESEWSTLRTTLIEHYMHYFKQKSIEWI